METEIDIGAFESLLKQKRREIYYTKHALAQAKSRNIVNDEETAVKPFENDILCRIPDIVMELEGPEKPDERKFKAYFKSEWGYRVYIMSIDGQISLITIYIISRRKQEKLYKYLKRIRGGSHGKRRL